jgi:AcrR family transcriptional regulator
VTRVPDRETRDRLLAAAARLFAERGFKKVTVRAICQAGKANVAAVNYHFGDKLGLYREVLQSAIDIMRSTSDAARRAGDGQPPDEQLRRYIHVYLQRVLADGGNTWIHRLVNREIADPTPVFDALVEQGIRPRMEYLAGLVAAIAGCAADDPRVLRCVASIQSQSVFYLPNPVASRLGVKTTFTAAEIDEIAQHITAFSLAGIHATAAAPHAGRRSPLRSTASRRR